MTTRLRKTRAFAATAQVASALVVLGLSVATTPAHAEIIGPYTANPGTLHLYHFDETDGNDAVTTVPTFVDAGSGTTTSLSNNRGVDGAAAFTGFGSAFDVEAGGVSASTLLTTGRASTTSSAGAQSLWQGANGAYTYELLVSTSSISANQHLLGRDGADNQRGWALSIGATGSLTWQIATGANTTAAVTAAIPTVGDHAFVADEWFHVAVAYDGNAAVANNTQLFWTRLSEASTEANLIGNGTLSADTLAFSNGTTLNLFGVGAFTRGPWRLQVLGKVDEVRISDTALTASQFMFTVPEPHSLGLVFFASLTLLRRRQHHFSRSV